MRFLALEVEEAEASPAAFQPHLKAEAARLWEGVREGSVRECAFDAEAHTAVLVLEGPDRAWAEAWLATLPLVKEGLIRFELRVLAPYTGFERLFA